MLSTSRSPHDIDAVFRWWLQLAQDHSGGKRKGKEISQTLRPSIVARADGRPQFAGLPLRTSTRWYQSSTDRPVLLGGRSAR